MPTKHRFTRDRMALGAKMTLSGPFLSNNAIARCAATPNENNLRYDSHDGSPDEVGKDLVQSSPFSNMTRRLFGGTNCRPHSGGEHVRETLFYLGALEAVL